MSQECIISSVLSFCSKNLKQRVDHCYTSALFDKQRKIHPQGMRVSWPKRHEEKREKKISFGSPSYIYFLLPLCLPYVNWDSQECCLFHLRFSLQFSDHPLFFFCELVPSFSFRHHNSGLFSYSNYLIPPLPRDEKPNYLEIGVLSLWLLPAELGQKES